MGDNTIQPQPVPLTFNTGTANAPDGTKLFVLQVHTFTGSHVSFLPDAAARFLRDQLDEFLTGIVRASSPLARQLADAMIPINGKRPKS